jgi:hypothetical protein
MNELVANLSLEFSGKLAEGNTLDLYDAAQAMLGLHRSLAITTHFILHGEVITQATALKDASILCPAPEAGSWVSKAVVLGWTTMAASVMYKVSTAPENTSLGHIVMSAYDYVLRSTTGQKLDYEKSIFEMIEEGKRQKMVAPSVTVERFESVAEKCESSLLALHRPFTHSGTATSCKITHGGFGGEVDLDHTSYDFLTTDRPEEDSSIVTGSISSYNLNTYKGRIYISELQRTVPFELLEGSRSVKTVQLLIASMERNNQRQGVDDIRFICFKINTKTGTLKKVFALTAEQNT